MTGDATDLGDGVAAHVRKNVDFWEAHVFAVLPSGRHIYEAATAETRSSLETTVRDIIKPRIVERVKHAGALIGGVASSSKEGCKCVVSASDERIRLVRAGESIQIVRAGKAICDVEVSSVNWVTRTIVFDHVDVRPGDILYLAGGAP